MFSDFFMNDKIEKLLNEAQMQAADSSSDSKSSVAAAERDFADDNEAVKHFARLKEKLVRIEHWNAHSALTAFALFDETGGARGGGAAQVGDFIRLTMTGSGKHDWVKILEIDDAPTDRMILSVQPSYDPTAATDASRKATSHFFTDESTNNFCLQRKDSKIIFHVVGLNEKTNTSDTNNLLETVRNAATANLGHYLGIQEGEWKTFCENFLETKNQVINGRF